MKYTYTIKLKAIFSREFTSSADSKKEIENAIVMEIPPGVWLYIEKGKKGIVENESFIVIIQKI